MRLLLIASFLATSALAIESSTSPSNASGPLVLIPDPIANDHDKSGTSEVQKYEPKSLQKTGEVKAVPKSEEKVESRKPEFRNFWTLRANGFFPLSRLSNRVGVGWGLGASLRTHFLEFLEPELSIDWLYSSKVVDGQDNFLNLWPLGLGVRFSRFVGPVILYASPELGGIFWNSGAKRVLDGEKTSSGGFDFLAATSLGALYEWKENSIFSVRVKFNFGAGYINQYFTTIGFEWSKRF